MLTDVASAVKLICGMNNMFMITLPGWLMIFILQNDNKMNKVKRNTRCSIMFNVDLTCRN